MTITPALAPGMTPPWMTAVESQLEAFTMIKRLVDSGPPASRQHGFLIDRALLGQAVPFMWSCETIDATLAASQSIPSDTPFSVWNLDTPAVWWWFERPLPFKTLEPHQSDGPIFWGVRALCFGWIYHNGHRFLGCSAWCDAEGMPDLEHLISITPSQTWTWNEDQPLDQVLTHVRTEHQIMYGPTGKFANMPVVGVDAFVRATDEMCRFILAGLAWINQKILVESDGHIERHRRKDFNRKTGQDVRSVRVVNLRRIERTGHAETDEDKREYSCRWTVGGHFRNQACGPKFGERRLTWVHPYVKGPDDKPLRVQRQKVYVVDR